MELNHFRQKLATEQNHLQNMKSENCELLTLVEKLVVKSRENGVQKVMAEQKTRMQGLYEKLSSVMGVAQVSRITEENENSDFNKEENKNFLGEFEKVLSGSVVDFERVSVRFGEKESVFLKEIIRQREINNKKDKVIEQIQQELFRSQQKAQSLLCKYIFFNFYNQD